ncbi:MULTISPECIES: mannitol dehydrogenase family protein [unclassified Microbacterium]|uniref:mannitol dehydrogenase family protein n=1 Tax=unclassified Microbacterium TaxID=2609290 RepID=UPI003646005D
MSSAKLSNQTLSHLSAGVATPAYDRNEVAVGIVHIGVGGFHRAHEAQYVDQVLGVPGQQNWAIAGIGMLPGDRLMKEVLDEQDGLYTLVTRTPAGTDTARVIGSLARYVLAADDPDGALGLLVNASTKIVSLTITEGGYPIDQHTGEFDPAASVIRADAARTDGSPKTAFGLIVEALRLRREQDLAPFTVMSCDNIQGNGEIARRSVVGMARISNPELGDWIEEYGAFPNSMVDRITPATTDSGRQFVTEKFGIEDRWPVISESFTQWVLEDSFVDGRPALERVGVQLVDDVRPYEAMKLRLLNASHQGVGYLGLLSGYQYVHEAVDDPVIAEFLLGYMTDEASPTLPPLPGIDLERYRHELLERFANPAIADTLARLVTDGTDRISTFLVPVLRDRLAAHQPIEHIALILAAWAEYVRTTVASGGPEALADSRREEVIAAVHAENPRGAELLSMAIFGDLRDDPLLIDAYTRARTKLHSLGPGVAMHALSTSKH